MKPIKRALKGMPFKLKKPLTPPILALYTVTSSTGKGVYASSDTLFKGAVFGRDSLEVAEDLLVLKPRLVRHILLTLASLQGLHESDISEEERGKIVHEYRTAIVDGRPLDNMTRHIFNELASKWGGNSAEMAYYGSVDATPHFIRVLGMYCERYGNKILDSKFTRRDGTTDDVRGSLMLALDWLRNKLAASNSGLLEYHARNPKGIENQVWKDSREFYVHENGELANHEQPIASIEVQGLVYDALLYGSKLLHSDANELAAQADELRTRTIELLWRPEKKYFALGIDYDNDLNMRCIETATANPAALLDTRFFNGLPQEERQQYIQGIACAIMGTDFLTDAGIRSRSLGEKALVKYWDYHGSFTSWPKETYDIAKGLRRQGLPKLATELENRLLNVIRKSRTYPEFVYVDFRGRVFAGAPSLREHGNLSLVDGTNAPENIQAWTVSAVLAITNSRLPTFVKRRSKQSAWEKELELEILSHIPHVPNLRGPKVLSARYPDYPYRLHPVISNKKE